MKKVKKKKRSNKARKNKKNLNIIVAKKNPRKANAQSLELKPFEVIVLATMSSGKSTLINALIGHDLLPASNEACTSRVFKIEDLDIQKSFTARLESESGSTKWIDVTPEHLMELNNSDEKGVVHVRGDIPSIENFDKQLILFDTPGPNNSQDKSHGQLTRQVLNDGQSGLIIYLLNATQFGVDDDAQLLSMVEEAFEKSNNHKDIVFILNKADQFDEEDGESITKTVSAVSDYVEKHGFNKPKIIPISAHAALLARKKAKNLPLTRKELRAFEDYLDHVEEGLPDIGRYAISVDDVLFDTENASDEDKVIYHSGILVLEKLLEQKVKI